MRKYADPFSFLCVIPFHPIYYPRTTLSCPPSSSRNSEPGSNSGPCFSHPTRLRLVPSRATSLPLCSHRRLLPTATAVAVAAAWALLSSSSTGCCVRYSLLVCCWWCATLLLLRSSYFPLFLPLEPPRPPYATRFSDISSWFRQTPDCSDILTFLSPHHGTCLHFYREKSFSIFFPRRLEKNCTCPRRCY